MKRRLQALWRSLGMRLVVPLSVTVAVVLAVHAVVSFRSTHEHFLDFVHTDAARCSGLIKRATHYGMLLNRLDEVQAIIERLAEQPEVAAIRVYDKDGVIVLSARTGEINQRIAIDSSTCRSCHGSEVTTDAALVERSGLASTPDGPEVLRHLTVIENDPECAAAACHFHPADERVLGVLDVEMSMAPLDAAIGTARTQLAWTTAVLILIIGLVSAAFVRRVVHRPAVQLYEGTRRIAAGDLETRIDVRGTDELARLAEAFNGMVGDLRTARREITEWSQKLEEKVREKTDELQSAQHQVLHMEKMASLGKLAATVAHELNNPISGVLTYARLVRRELGEQTLSAEVREELTRYLRLIEKECARCGEVVKNLLTFARRSDSELTRVDLNDVVERSLMLMRHHLEISNVRLRVELLEGDPEIVVDAGKLQQALVALFVNAAEAMSAVADRPAELAVRLAADETDMRIEVEDTGAGIPPDALPHIFEPFFSTKKNESGVGLGLAVVYGIVQQHGGTIEVESNEGRGTTFRIQLPRQPREVDHDEPVAAIASG